jgi:hypothetical protein
MYRRGKRSGKELATVRASPRTFGPVSNATIAHYLECASRPFMIAARQCALMTELHPHHTSRAKHCHAHDMMRLAGARQGSCGLVYRERPYRSLVGPASIPPASPTRAPRSSLRRARLGTPIPLGQYEGRLLRCFRLLSNSCLGFVQKRTRFSVPRVQYSAVRCKWRQHVTWRVQCIFGQFATRSRP